MLLGGNRPVRSRQSCCYLGSETSATLLSLWEQGGQQPKELSLELRLVTAPQSVGCGGIVVEISTPLSTMGPRRLCYPYYCM